MPLKSLVATIMYTYNTTKESLVLKPPTAFCYFILKATKGKHEATKGREQERLMVTGGPPQSTYTSWDGGHAPRPLYHI